MTTAYRDASDGLRARLAEVEALRDRLEREVVKQRVALKQAQAAAWQPTTIVGVVGALATVFAAAIVGVVVEADASEQRAQVQANYERRLDAQESALTRQHAQLRSENELLREQQKVDPLCPHEKEALHEPIQAPRQTIFAQDASSL